jgi:hypothetical protein
VTLGTGKPQTFFTVQDLFANAQSLIMTQILIVSLLLFLIFLYLEKEVGDIIFHDMRCCL